MDPTAIKQGPPLTKTTETTAETGTNGTAPKPATQPRPQTKSVLRRWLEHLADLRITVALFALSMLLVFWGTLAQADVGVWTAVTTYFRSFFVWIPLKVVFFNLVENKTDGIPFPGGLLLGFIMLFNLLAAHAIRFKLTWGRSGILLIHAGIIVMMLGEFITYKFAHEAHMSIPIGGSVNYVVSDRQFELAVVQNIDAKKDSVIVVPASKLQPGATIHDENLPFDIEVLTYMVNSSDLLKPTASNRATRGLGLKYMVQPKPEVSGVDPEQRVDIPSAYLRLRRGDRDLGVWLFSAYFSENFMQMPETMIQEVTVDGKAYRVTLRPVQKERPYSMHLTKFTQDFYPGTTKPKDFHSYIHLTDPETGVDRHVEIYMNAPLRYRGETFYQSSVSLDGMQKPTGTVLQVVRNPGWLLPYFSCAIVGIGMLIHFGLTLRRFIDKRTAR